jgi:hypothetical protein
MKGWTPTKAALVVAVNCWLLFAHFEQPASPPAPCPEQYETTSEPQFTVIECSCGSLLPEPADQAAFFSFLLASAATLGLIMVICFESSDIIGPESSPPINPLGLTARREDGFGRTD